MQVPFQQFSSRPQGALSIIASIWRHQGWLGFWHGQLGTLIRETGGSAAWFGSYEGVSLLFRSLHRKKKEEALPIWQQMSAGAVAGMAYNFIFYPADTIKSRMQTEDSSKMTGGNRTFGAVGKALWKEHGVRGLYRGCGITVLRSAPSSAFIFTVYEGLRRHFG
jgi:ornithine carrier protein